MTSSRGQTVSVLPRPGVNSVAVFCDTGTSLGSSSSRKISLKAEKTAFRKERSFAQHYSKNVSTNVSTTFQNREGGRVKKCSDSLITNSVSSSSFLNSVNRELSPVRWCDREVDGVYLGRSGWVQVQQKSLDDCKDVFYKENIGFSTLPTRKNFFDLRPDCRFEERKECNRPLNLPLATNRRVIRENYERSSKFTKEFESASPPSITPIISPPPAFKDEGLDAEFLMQSVREPYFCKKSFLRKSEICADSGIFPSSLSGRPSALNTSPSTFQNESVLSSTSKHQRLPNKALHAKSFEDDRSHKMWCNRRFNSTSLFRSVDNDIRITDERKLSVSDSFPKSFGRPEKKSAKERGEDTGNEKTVNKQHFLGLQSSSWEALSDNRFLSEAFPRLSYQSNKRRDFNKDCWNSYRIRSSSLDSNSSSSNCSNNSKSASSSSSCSRSSIDYKNFDKTISRDTDLTFESQQFQFENSLSGNCPHFNVKRSRSLQLCEKKSTNESVPMLLNNSMSENSYDSVRLLENSTFQTKNQKKKKFSGTILNHVLVTVNNESIPVISSNNQSLKSLNKITKSAAEQKKLIMEAEKEARIISEFMNGTRSRAAARNLLMHRYFHQSEDENSTILMEKKNPPKTEYDSCFVMANQCPSNKPKNLDERSFRKKNQSKPSTPDLGHSEPLNSAFSNSSQGSHQSANFTSSRNYLNQKKMEKIESKQREKSHSVYSDNREKRKKQNASFPLYRACFDSIAQKEKLSLFLNQKHKKLNNYEEHNCSNEKLKRVPSKTVLEIEKRHFQNNSFEENSLISSSSSSASSSDVCMNDLDIKFKKTKIITRSSAPFFKDYVQDTNSKTLQERFRFRPGSAPESKVCIPKTIDKRSLSLPRSFLSKRCRLNNFYSRTLLPLKQGHSETPVESPEMCYLNSQGVETAPATPVRDLRYGNSTGSLYQIPSYRSSSASLFGETPLFKSRRIIQENAPKYLEQSAENSNEINTYCSDKKLLKISDSSSETILQILKKKFSIKYLKRREHLRDCSERTNNGTKTETVEAFLCTAKSPTSSLQALENDCGDFSQLTHGFFGRKRIFKNEKYGSHDSGIQVINRRGIVDSTESRDTDIQEGADSPLVVRKHEIRSKGNFYKPKLDCNLDWNHILTDNLKTDLRMRTKNSTGKVVRRSHSDLGDNRLLSWNVNEKYGDGLSLYYSPIRGCNVRTTWGSPSSSEVSITLNRFERLLKSGLRRSLSQPVGLNDSSSSESWKPSTLKEFVLRENKKNSRPRNSESEFLSDSESSVSSSCERKKSFDSLPRLETAVFAEAVWDHVVIESDELPFRAGDVIEVLDMRDRDWWWGIAKENIGYFPSAFVRLPVSQEDTVENCLAAMSKGKNTSKQLRRGKSISFLSNDQVRSRIIKELLNTERDFVKILHDIKDGYMTQCKQRIDMFTSAQITTIFSNIEDLLTFQNKFLKDLEANIDKEFPFKSCVGEVFLNHGSSFRMYSEYCNSHPMAIATLQDLYQKYSYCKFFEMCRLKQNLIEISLDGYLLTPVQRICKYPLQLGELLKYTKPDHPDYKNVQEALETMRSVATLINERKRKMESLEKLAAWQQKVEGWEGEDLIEISSQLIHQGDVIKITSGMWTTNITLFLFDHQIIYCKKDLLKKNVYIYKGRISLDESDVIDLPDGKCQQLGVSIRYGLRINNHLKNKWLVFCCRSNQDKIKWLEVLAEEKKLVAEDKEKNLNLSQTAKQLAKMSVRTNKFPSCKLKGKNKFAFNRHALICTESHSGVPKSKSNKKTGMWFPFGGLMKNTKAGLTHRIPLHKFI